LTDRTSASAAEVRSGEYRKRGSTYEVFNRTTGTLGSGLSDQNSRALRPEPQAVWHQL